MERGPVPAHSSLSVRFWNIDQLVKILRAQIVAQRGSEMHQVWKVFI
jgi:hypothetical protein